LTCTSIKAASSPYQHYDLVAKNNALPATEKLKEIDVYLRSLSHPEFMSFLYELSKTDEYKKNNPDIGVLMGLHAQSYLCGPGQSVLIVETIKQVVDPKLVYWWKVALLGVLQLDDLELMDIDTTKQITQYLCNCASDKSNPDILRALCLKRLNAFLQTQEGHILVKHPQLRGVFKTRNIEMIKEVVGLSKADVEFIKVFFQIVSIYNAAVQKAFEELRDTRGLTVR